MTLYLANVSVSRNCNYNTYLRDLLYILQLTLFLITASTYLRMLQYLIIAIVNWTCYISQNITLYLKIVSLFLVIVITNLRMVA